MDMRVDHLSVAVDDLDAGLRFFRSCLPIEMGIERHPGYSGDFEWCDFYVGSFKLELIAPAGGDGFVRRFLERRGEGMHHLSIEVADLEALARRFEADGKPLVDRFDAGGGYSTAFVSPRHSHGVLIQFWQVPRIEEPERPRRAALRLRSGEAVRLCVDHVAIAVRDIDRTLGFFERYFPVQIRRPKHIGYDPSFALASFRINGYKIELIQQAPAAPPGFVARFLERRGEGLHHISIDVDRLDPLLEQLRADGVRIVDERDFGNGRKTAFISPRSAHGVLVQFWQEPEFGRS